ncbi:uncharacterized protein AAGF69_010935 [Amazona ochrocephala]
MKTNISEHFHLQKDGTLRVCLLFAPNQAGWRKLDFKPDEPRHGDGAAVSMAGCCSCLGAVSLDCRRMSPSLPPAPISLHCKLTACRAHKIRCWNKVWRSSLGAHVKVNQGMKKASPGGSSGTWAERASSHTCLCNIYGLVS